MNDEKRNEADTRAELVEQQLKEAGWGASGSRVRREYHIKIGRVQGSGKRQRTKPADFVLIYRGKILAAVEAKPESDEVTEGRLQVIEYAENLEVRYAYCTNGHGIHQINMETGEEGAVSAYPSPDELWALTYDKETPGDEEIKWRGKFSKTPFENRGGTWKSRYYQDIAIERVLEAIARGRNRILLTMATGTGKTAVAFQIAWKLYKQRWTLAKDCEREPRILFLADRNILADQAFNAFSAFPEGALTRITPDSLRKRGRPPTHASVFFTIFQTFMSRDSNDAPFYKRYPPDFFDFIVIDECHRGGANDESTWREIMEHFEPAVQLGLTATPNRRVNADTYKYFGKAVYEYSLQSGIDGGFLAPYRVRRYETSIDKYAYDPSDRILTGEAEEGKVYGERDFNRIIEIKTREKYRVDLFMKEINQREKTIVFCATQEHALLVQQLISAAANEKNVKYCARVTSDEGEIGEQYLREFQDDDKTIPTILTTSRKLSTGVDAKNVRHIVLMRPIKTIIEFKQIIGRGTRLYRGKHYFTIHDFVDAYLHFKDPLWDGDPEQVDGDDTEKPEKERAGRARGERPSPPESEKLRIELADGKVRQFAHISSTSFYDLDGSLMSAEKYIKRLFADIPKVFTNEDNLRELWGRPETRKDLLEALDELGYDSDQLKRLVDAVSEESSDIFDLLAYIAYDRPTKSRRARADAFPWSALDKYDPGCREFLTFVLEQYVKEGVDELDSNKLRSLIRSRYSSATNAERIIGSLAAVKSAFEEFQAHLYQP